MQTGIFNTVRGGGGFTANMEVGRGNPKSQEGEILHPAKGITIYIERR